MEITSPAGAATAACAKPAAGANSSAATTARIAPTARIGRFTQVRSMTPIMPGRPGPASSVDKETVADARIDIAVAAPPIDGPSTANVRTRATSDLSYPSDTIRT